MNSSDYNFSKDFFLPLLQTASIYYRGVGYFSSTWIKCNYEGIVDFVNNGGQIKWLTSPILNEEDLRSFETGEEAKINDLLKIKLAEAVENFPHALKNDTLNALAWMIADGVIEIKIAIPCNKLTGEFHDKFGYFEDYNGNCLSFSGSNNESQNGLYSNYESFTIFYSWSNSEEISKNSSINKYRFLRIWNNEDDNLNIYNIPSAIKQDIIKLRKSNERPYRISTKPIKPSHYSIRPYQIEACKNWIKNNYNGIFAMATGTGKTITALYCILSEYLERLKFNDNEKYQILIIAPTKTLVEQWENEVKLFNFKNIIKAYSNENWKIILKDIIEDYIYLSLNRDFIIISTYSTFTSNFASFFSKLPNDTIMIADEVHNMGSPKIQNIINMISFKKKLALSATPKRVYDTKGSQNIEDFFNSAFPYTYNISLKDAIERDILCKYYYTPILVEFSDEEFANYINITNEINRMSILENEDNLSEAYKQKLIARKSKG